MSFVKLKKEIKQRPVSFIFLFYILRSSEQKEISERNFSLQAIWRAHFEGIDRQGGMQLKVRIALILVFLC